MTTPHHHSHMHRCARTLATRGWPIFPCTPAAKRPLTKRGCHDAATNPDQIDTWWAKWPTANIALATGRPDKHLLVVDLDIDPNKNLDGFSTWADLVHQHAPGAHPGLGTLAVRTPRGGLHLYFHATTSAESCRNSESTLGRGIDTRGKGGYVLVPPSHTAHGVYTRAVTEPIQDAPDWLLRLLEPPQRRANTEALVFVPPANTDRYTTAAINGEMDRVRSAPNGTRNHTLFIASIALGQLVGGGSLTENDAETALLTAATGHIGIDGFTQNEVETAIRSGLQRGMAEPRTITPRKAG